MLKFGNVEETPVRDQELKDDMTKIKNKIKRTKRASQGEGIEFLLDNEKLPAKGEELIYFSKHHINSMHFIGWVASEEVIEHAYLVTFRLGTKQRQELINLQESGRINKVELVISQVQSQNDKANESKNKNTSSYNYWEDIENLKLTHNWDIHLYNTHAKCYLLKTKNNYYIIFSSGNLNGNPKNEFFNIRNSKEIFEFTKDFYDSEIGKDING